jgi:hypothetical protein
MTRIAKPVDQRFNEKVNFGDEDSCWNWTASVDKDGYGLFNSDSERRAHRFAYVREFGGDISGLCICHRCDNPSCVNPKHLFIGTMADNMADMERKGRARHPGRKGSASHLKGRGPFKLTAEKAVQIASSVLSHRQLAALYGVDRTMIYQIKAGKSWSSVTGITRSKS